MKFKYRKTNLLSPFSEKDKLLRPIIPVSIKYKQRSIYYEALIDSGADFCIFPIAIGRKLGISLDSAKRIYFAGATGDPVLGLIEKISLQIGETTFNTKIVFADLSGKKALLGQYGFFDKFIVKFDFKREEIEIKSII